MLYGVFIQLVDSGTHQDAMNCDGGANRSGSDTFRLGLIPPHISSLHFAFAVQKSSAEDQRSAAENICTRGDSAKSNDLCLLLGTVESSQETLLTDIFRVNWAITTARPKSQRHAIQENTVHKRTRENGEQQPTFDM